MEKLVLIPVTSTDKEVHPNFYILVIKQYFIN